MKILRLIVIVATVASIGYEIGAVRRGSAVIAAPSPAARARYQAVPLGTGQYALLVDTISGKTWYLAFASYCQDKTDPTKVWSVGSSTPCQDTQEALPPVPQFEKISVEDLYTTPSDASLRRDAVETLMRSPK